MGTTTVWGEIDGREITFPMEVPAFDATTMGFAVPAAEAASLLPGSAFEIVEIGPGVAQLVLAVCDYRDNPWGDYNEVNLGFLARPTGGPADVVGSFVYRMPVDQAFTCEAGNRVMGFPKTVEEIDVETGADEVVIRLRSEGVEALSVVLPRVAAAGPAPRIEAESYSYLDGVPHVTPLAMDMGTGVVDPASVRVAVGAGPIADELRRLGLPRQPDFCTWGEGLSATFQLGRPLP
ncbi:MAG TPA: acetoacetate decarboxylase family protein [Acidimicrobiales bacterium]|nr:acetoacetate decarboxylase family protein [Acidimicrobiales bacterium]